MKNILKKVLIGMVLLAASGQAMAAEMNARSIARVERAEKQECPVCYENKPLFKLRCHPTHRFCTGCLKQEIETGRARCALCARPMARNEIAEIAPENQLRLERIANIRTLREARTKLLHQLNALNLGLNIGVLGLHIITNTVIEPNPQFMHYVGITQVAAALGVASLKLHHRYYYGMPEED